MSYYHSVTLLVDKCKGCTNCLRRCPTEAIRIRDGRSRIIKERCIDCGECIRVCPYHAKIAQTDPFSSIAHFPYKIALPAPSLYGQFKGLTSIARVLSGLHALGFDDVYEVARGADIVTCAIDRRIEQRRGPFPIISSACPAVVRLIQVRFPELIEHIVDVRSPMEVAATIAKREFCAATGANVEEVGAFFITPCAAKMTAIRNPVGHHTSAVDGAISIIDIYGVLAGQVKQPMQPLEARATVFGTGWANAGGESRALQTERVLHVDGIHNVIRALEEIENNRFHELDFFEGLACEGGCVGGPLTFENNYVSQMRIQRLVRDMRMERPDTVIDLSLMEDEALYADAPIHPNPVMKLDDDILVAMRLMEEMKRINDRLPGLDCGSCGSPSCQTLAEDIVRGNAMELDCIFKLREKVAHLAQEMVDLSASTRLLGNGQTPQKENTP